MGAKSRIAPHQNYPPRTVPCWIPTGLDPAGFKSGISLTAPWEPKSSLQSLPPILRINPAGPIRSCSKAPGVFSSNYRYPASSPEVHFHRASPRDSFPVITPFVHVGTSCSSRISTGTDYIFIWWRATARISLRVYLLNPLGFIWNASLVISSKPLSVVCFLFSIRRHTRLNNLKSFAFPDMSGYCSKCGITFVRRSCRLRTSYLRVLSFISLLMNPHPNFFCMRNSTSARSWFCPTQKLGFVSHPIKNLSHLEKDTEKHPSPSEKPEIYSPRSLCFVFSVGVLWRVIVLLHDSTIPVATG